MTLWSHGFHFIIPGLLGKLRFLRFSFRLDEDKAEKQSTANQCSNDYQHVCPWHEAGLDTNKYHVRGNMTCFILDDDGDVIRAHLQGVDRDGEIASNIPRQRAIDDRTIDEDRVIFRVHFYGVEPDYALGCARNDIHTRGTRDHRGDRVDDEWPEPEAVRPVANIVARPDVEPPSAIR